MKAQIANVTQLHVGKGDGSSDQEILTEMIKHWGQKLGYCSIFAAVPAILLSQISEARSDEAKKPEANVPGRRARLRESFKISPSTPGLLKRQSEFRLPHQKEGDIVTPAGGNDDCPGRAIPGGNYTAAAPYTDSGDTTGANDTVNRVFYYYYYSFETAGPDHIYTFTLTGRGPNPQIEVSTTSGSYQPLIYIVQGGYSDACPGGTGKNTYPSVIFDSRWSMSHTAVLNKDQMNYLPLNIPLHLFIDSRYNDATGSGAYTVRVQDLTIAPACPDPRPLDCPDFFVRQHYLDFLNRPADTEGLVHWTNEITSCDSNLQCVEVKRINVSAAFYLSIEFQDTGYLVERLYKAAYGDEMGTSLLGGSHQIPVPVVRFNEFLPDTQQVANGVIVNQQGWEQVLENNKQAFTSEFVQRTRFTSAFPTSMTAAQFVDKLNTNAGNPLADSERNQLVNDLSAGTKTRAQVLRAVAEDYELYVAEFNRAFVLMQYFGYLRRNPNDPQDADYTGYDFWLTKLEQFNGNYVQAEMVKAFLLSTEYQHRF